MLGFGLLIVLGTVPSAQIAASADWSLAQVRGLFGTAARSRAECSSTDLTRIHQQETPAPLVVWMDLSGNQALAEPVASRVFSLLGAVNLSRVPCDAHDLTANAAADLARTLQADLLISGHIASDGAAQIQLTYSSGPAPADYPTEQVLAPSGPALPMVIATFVLRRLDLPPPAASYRLLHGQAAPSDRLQQASLSEALGLAALAEGRTVAATNAFSAAAALYQATGEPDRRARAMRGLGDAFASDIRMLEAATIAYREALTDRLRQASPVEWAQVQHDLARTLMHLAELTGRPDRAELAIATYKVALAEVPRSRAPLIWAQYQFGLGSALLAYGQFRRDPATLRLATTVLARALDESARTTDPRTYAQTVAALGHSYQLIGDLSHQANDFVLASEAYETALKIWPADQDAVVRSQVQIRRGMVLQRLGEQFGQLGKEELAVEALAAALVPELRAKDQWLWAETQARLGAMLYDLGVENSSPGWLNQAETAYRAALEVHNRISGPREWAKISLSLGQTLLSLGEMMSSTMTLQQARSTLGDVMLVPVPLQDELSFAKAELLSATAIRALYGLDMQNTDLTGAWDLAISARQHFAALQAPHYLYQADKLLRTLAARLNK